MGVTRLLAHVLIRQFLRSYWSRATAGKVVPHHAICATPTAFPFRSCLPEGRGGLYHFIAGGVLG